MPEAAPVTSPVAHGVQISAAVAGFLAGSRLAIAASGADLTARNRVAAMQALAAPRLGPGDSHVATGSPNVRINGFAAGRVGDLTDIGEVIVAGSSSVFINGRPAARFGDPTSRGGVIIGGSRNVFIGGGTTSIGTLGPVMNPPCAALAKALDFAVMSQHAYGADPTMPPGYTFIDPKTEEGRQALAKLDLKPADVDPPRSTFKADVFRRAGVDGDQYVVAYKGTDVGSKEDVKTDLLQSTGFKTGQYDRASMISQKIAGNQDTDVEYTGHSLGGGLASTSAASQNRPATTFNSAGLSANTIGGYPDQSAPVDAYFVSGEPLSAVQDNRILVLGALGPAAIGFNAYRGYVQKSPTIPKAYGTRHRIPRAAPPGLATSGLLGFRKWHGIDWMIASLAAQRTALGCP